jgi:shikimate kinase
MLRPTSTPSPNCCAEGLAHMSPDDNRGQRPVIVLIGPPGSGKSMTGRALAKLLKVELRDTDADIVRTAGKEISDIFIDDGEPRFRSLERDAVLLALRTHDGVLALGGGSVLDPLTEGALADYSQAGGVVVFLDVSLAHVASRVGFNQSRPFLLGNPRARWQSLMQVRRPVYERVATHRVGTDAKTVQVVAAEIVETVLSTREKP